MIKQKAEITIEIHGGIDNFSVVTKMEKGDIPTYAIVEALLKTADELVSRRLGATCRLYREHIK